MVALTGQKSFVGSEICVALLGKGVSVSDTEALDSALWRRWVSFTKCGLVRLFIVIGCFRSTRASFSLCRGCQKVSCSPEELFRLEKLPTDIEVSHGTVAFRISPPGLQRKDTSKGLVWQLSSF